MRSPLGAAAVGRAGVTPQSLQSLVPACPPDTTDAGEEVLLSPGEGAPNGGSASRARRLDEEGPSLDQSSAIKRPRTRTVGGAAAPLPPPQEQPAAGEAPAAGAVLPRAALEELLGAAPAALPANKDASPTSGTGGHVENRSSGLPVPAPSPRWVRFDGDPRHGTATDHAHGLPASAMQAGRRIHTCTHVLLLLGMFARPRPVCTVSHGCQRKRWKGVWQAPKLLTVQHSRTCTASAAAPCFLQWPRHCRGRRGHRVTDGQRCRCR